MKTKEAIRKDIVHYANLTWDDFNINKLNPLLRLMIEVISQELFLLDNRIKDIKYSVQQQLVRNLSPSAFKYIRASHAILKVDPSCPVYNIEKEVSFVLKELPSKARKKDISSVSYTPVTNTSIYDMAISHLFFDKILWNIDSTGNKKIVGTAGKRAEYNTLWLGLEIGPGIDNLKGVPFYLDFEHLADHHIYYELLSEQLWDAGGRTLEMKQGYPVNADTSLREVESEVLDLYNSHFQTITSDLPLSELKQELPQELRHILHEEVILSIPPLYWLAITFPASMNPEDVEKVFFALNAFPVMNREYNESTIGQKETGYTTSLSSRVAQEFLDIESVTDSNGNVYHPGEELSKQGDYTIEALRRKNVEDPRILDYLERLVDILHDERTAFVGIDKDKIEKVFNAVFSIQERDTHRVYLNHLLEYAEVGLLNLIPYEEISEIGITYWTTHADLLNGIPRGTRLMASKIPELNKSKTVFLTDTTGGRSFYESDSLVAINRFYMTSKGRILTKSDILNYCRIELGETIEEIDVKRKAVISIRKHEGIIIVMEIQIKPLSAQIETIKQKNFLNELLCRLRQKSPNNFNYRIKIIE